MLVLRNYVCCLCVNVRYLNAVVSSIARVAQPVANKKHIAYMRGPSSIHP